MRLKKIRVIINFSHDCQKNEDDCKLVLRAVPEETDKF